MNGFDQLAMETSKRPGVLRLDLQAAAAETAGNGAGPSRPRSPSSSTRTNQLQLTFHDISYSVRSGILSKERKQLLTRISGDFRPGELTAIMGPSGAGKSTLMDILAGFTRSDVTGDVRVNGRSRDLSAFRRSSAYIMQDDHLQPLLTVLEAMNIAANLKLDVDDMLKKQGVESILKEIGLDEVRTTCTGNLSGGQKKRLCIALELISNPPIMFFDEPTSGLDSVASRQCLALLKALASKGRTVVITIHQPSAILFDMFDHLYVLAEGCCAYAGGSRNLLPFLQSLDLNCPTHYSLADFLLEIVNGDYGDSHLPRLIKSSENGRCGLWRTKPETRKLEQLTATGLELMPRLPLPSAPMFYESENKGSAHYATGFLSQLRVLIFCNIIKLSRDRVLTFMRLTMHLVIALLVGTIFYKIGQDAAYALDNFNMLFFNIMFLMFSAFSATLINFPQELPILMREHFNRWYKLRSFYMANKLADLPVQMTAATLFNLIVYYMSDQIPELDRMLMYFLMCFVISLVAQNIGLVAGISFSLQNGVIFGPFFILPFLIFSGFFIHLQDSQPYLHWLFHISFLKYGFEGVMVAIYGNNRPKMNCSDDYCHYSTPKKLLDAVDMKSSNYWYSLTLLICLYILLDLLAYFLLRLRVRKRAQYIFF